MATMKTRQDVEAQSVAEQAAHWLLILEDGTAADRSTFADWLTQSPTHVSALLRAAAVDTLLNEFDRERSFEIGAGSCQDDKPDIIPTAAAEPAAVRRRSSLFGWRWPLAAGVAVLAVTGAWFGVHPLLLDSWKHYLTSVGEQRVLRLEDGSVMFLSPGSKVATLFTGKERRLRLEAGQAMFRVYPDTVRPFRVGSGGSVIQAIGTQFSVTRVQDESIVSVIKGAVQISSERNLLKTLRATATGAGYATAPPVRLSAGEETRVAADGRIAAPRHAEIDRVRTWQDRRLTFINEPLAAIAEEFNRYNRVPSIRIADTTAGERRYAAAFDADDPQSLIVVLERDPKLQVTQQGDEIIIRSRFTGATGSASGRQP